VNSGFVRPILVADDSLPTARMVDRNLRLNRPRRTTFIGMSESTRPLETRAGTSYRRQTLLILLAPVMLLVAIAVRLGSPRSRYFFDTTRVGLNLRQENDAIDAAQRFASQVCPTARRIDANSSNVRRRDNGYGKPFTLYKFRTMRSDAEKNGPQLAIKGDQRVTSIGRFLRKNPP